MLTMEIFNPHFKKYLKRILICRILGHKPSVWMIEAKDNFRTLTGRDVKSCERCYLTLKTRKSRFNPSNIV